MTKRHEIRTIVAFRAESTAHDPESLLVMSFMETYRKLRRVAPEGDLTIHLSVEADSSEEAIAVLDIRRDKDHE